ncbi:hypothetical protein PF002_g20166 [Phytophthora fragariae]|uniref:Uncharacterized protein n=1 Tax=Phytophthora fragariae TaxID=53985 RepID=A0A6A3XPR5_9STRA|nr:hypothetical protein PF003_g8629 [Phytophthora fragariae]KAE8992465.1 hypothetical protein PF011_g17541 [Phytophthora fragariae]KAE9205925.1 hypothetical protein PF002_g20166 [Phytophthora fragariae]KAE9206586.1 hypothetical protein PF004_g17255 [Phytophthora fragariae]KAE9295705.1 hypothetical protein PF001_g17205 [Phytophthora fragariae]
MYGYSGRLKLHLPFLPWSAWQQAGDPGVVSDARQPLWHCKFLVTAVRESTTKATNEPPSGHNASSAAPHRAADGFTPMVLASQAADLAPATDICAEVIYTVPSELELAAVGGSYRKEGEALQPQQLHVPLSFGSAPTLPAFPPG